MAEIWGAAIAVGGAALSAYSKSKSDKAAADRASADAKAATRDEALYSGLLSQFQMGEEYRYQQMNRQNKERGLAEFRKFNNMQRIAPNYTQDVNTGIKVPDKQDITSMLPAQDQGGGGKKKRSLLDKLGNPLGL